MGTRPPAGRRAPASFVGADCDPSCMSEEKRLPRGVTDQDLARAELRAALRRSRAAEMSDWDGRFAMLKHPGLTHEQALAAERAAAEAELAAAVSWDELARLRARRMQEQAAARREEEQARAAARFAEGVRERGERNRSFLPPWRAILFVTALLIVLVAPYWGK